MPNDLPSLQVESTGPKAQPIPFDTDRYESGSTPPLEIQGRSASEEAQLASVALLGDIWQRPEGKGDLTQVDFRPGNSVDLSKLSDIANSSVGRRDLGTRVPSDAYEFAGMKVPQHLNGSSPMTRRHNSRQALTTGRYADLDNHRLVDTALVN
ncbi:MAG: hypothetical protein K8F91_19455 [Candidatus Obscuribacterales bacterium]|nr:hypothetical protein [Candidatus Obscuribacterales bacterium]